MSVNSSKQAIGRPARSPLQAYRARDNCIPMIDCRHLENLDFDPLYFSGCLDALDDMPGGSMKSLGMTGYYSSQIVPRVSPHQSVL